MKKRRGFFRTTKPMDVKKPDINEIASLAICILDPTETGNKTTEKKTKNGQNS